LPQQLNSLPIVPTPPYQKSTYGGKQVELSHTGWRTPT
jgi:hypothetical protein